MKKLPFLLFFVLIFQSLQAAFLWNPDAARAYESIIRLRFGDGKKHLARERTLHPENDLIPYIENYIDFLTLLIGEEEEQFKIRQGNKDLRLSRLERGDRSSPWYLVTRAEIYLQWAAARLKFGEYVTAGYEIHKAYRLLLKNDKLFPDFIPTRKSLGLLHALIGTIPDEYNWVKNLVGAEGSVSQGVREMQSVLDRATVDSSYAFLKTEVFFLLTFVQLNLQLDGIAPNAQSGAYADKLQPIDEVKTNPLYAYSRARIAMAEGNNEEVIWILSQRPASAAYYPFHYLDYLHGVALQEKLDPGAALYFKRFIGAFKGRNYLKAARQRLAWTYLLQENETEYRRMLAQIPDKGFASVGADKQADKAARDGSVPNIRLLKARLLFDGGYFRRALQVLVAGGSAQAYDTREEQVEFLYRLGRIHHELDHIDKAKTYYALTLKEGKDLPVYFAANAALNLGLIYEEEKNVPQAKIRFKQCLALKDHEYYQSLSQKAKAGLNRVEVRSRKSEDGSRK